MVTKKHFEAILSKNDIARTLKEFIKYGKKPSKSDMEFIFTRLYDIENYIGEANQPSIEDILQSDYNL